MQSTKYLVIVLFSSLLAAVLPAQAQTAAGPLDEMRKQIEASWLADDWSKVEALSRQIIASGQAKTQDFRNLRFALTKQGKAQEAMQLRLSIVQRADANSDDYNDVCWAYLEQYKPTEARPYCQKAVDLKSTNWAASVNLGHSWLLAGNNGQAMPWYRKSLRSIRKEDDLKQGPLADFDLFIKNGWAVADAQAGKAWYEQGWGTLQGLNAVREQLPELAKKGQEMEAMRQSLKAMNDSATLLGDDATMTKIFARHHVISATELAKRQIKESSSAPAQQTIDSAFATVGHRLSDEELWNYWADLAQAYDANHQHDKALALNEKVLASRTAKLGADHPDTLTSMSTLAVTYGALGQHGKALALNEKVLASRTAKPGADHPATLISMNNLAVTYGALGQHDKALALNEKVLASRTAKLGADHPDTLTSMENLSLTYRKLKQYAKAQTLLQKYLPLKVARDGEKNDRARLSMALLVRTEEALGRDSGFMQKYSPETQATVKDKVARLRATGDWGFLRAAL